jgi:hypothetical protein
MSDCEFDEHGPGGMAAVLAVCCLLAVMVVLAVVVWGAWCG